MTGAGPPDDLYRILGVPPDASAADITRAYRRRARTVHPDAHPDARPDGGSARFQTLAAAYRVLGDPARRAAYDRSLRGDAGDPALRWAAHDQAFRRDAGDPALRWAAHDQAFRRDTSGLDPLAWSAAGSSSGPPAPTAAPARPTAPAPPSWPPPSRPPTSWPVSSWPAGYPAGAALWAGPTLVEPPAAGAGPGPAGPRPASPGPAGPGPAGPGTGPTPFGSGPAAADRVRLALLALLLARHLDGIGEGWPW